MHYQTNSSAYGPIAVDQPWVTQNIAWLNLVGRVPGGNARQLQPMLQSANHDGLVELAATVDNAKDRTGILAHTLALEPFAHGFSGLRARFSDALFALPGWSFSCCW